MTDGFRIENTIDQEMEKLEMKDVFDHWY